MKAPQIPENEPARLAALRSLDILDTEPEERLDQFTRLARHLFDVPIVLISLVDAERQWFKSRQGLDACETPRDISFCGHAILDQDIFVIEDALLDPRFADNPLVIGPTNVRFYAGCPIHSADGLAVGTLCLVDHRPRTINAVERRRLRDLAGMVEREIQLRALTRQVEAMAAQERERLEQLVQQRTAELEAAKQRAEQMSEAAARANLAKSQFLANMSHEIRTPMTAILGYASLLADEPDRAKRRSHVEIIRRNGEHLLDVINDILDLSKIDSGKLSVSSELCDIVEIIADVTSLMHVRALESKIDLTAELATPIPRLVVGDPVRIRQILTNLVANAIKFTPAGFVRITGRLRESPAPRLLLEVTDSGIGMSEATLAQLFVPFSQGDGSSARQFPGTGLGLAISRRLAHLIGGEIRVQSTLGMGSTFTLELPVGPLDRERLCTSLFLVQPGPEAATPREAVDLSGLNVLLAEDASDLRALVTSILRSAGAVVEAAADGFEAFERGRSAMYRGAPFSVVLMDMQMPRLTGYEAAARLRQIGYRGPIVALTAHAMAGERERCLAAGCDDYLTKPIRAGALLETAARLGRSGAIPAASAPDDTTDAALYRSAFGDQVEIAECLPFFYEGLAERTRQLAQALRPLDRVALEGLAHQLTGAGGTFGFGVLTQRGRALERALRQGSGDAAVASLAEHLLSSCARILAAPRGAGPSPSSSNHG